MNNKIINICKSLYSGNNIILYCKNNKSTTIEIGESELFSIVKALRDGRIVSNNKTIVLHNTLKNPIKEINEKGKTKTKKS